MTTITANVKHTHTRAPPHTHKVSAHPHTHDRLILRQTEISYRQRFSSVNSTLFLARATRLSGDRSTPWDPPHPSWAPRAARADSGLVLVLVPVLVFVLDFLFIHVLTYSFYFFT